MPTPRRSRRVSRRAPARALPGGPSPLLVALALAHVLFAAGLLYGIATTLGLDTILRSYLALCLLGVQLWWADALRRRHLQAYPVGLLLGAGLATFGIFDGLRAGCGTVLVPTPALLLGAFTLIALATPTLRRDLVRHD